MSGFTPDRIRDRSATALGVLLFTFLMLIGAFFRAQVIGYKDYRLASEKNRLRQVALLAPRGTIYDRNGLAIAENEPGYTVKLFAPSADSLRAVLSRFSAIVALTPADVEAVVRRYRTAQYQAAVVFSSAQFADVSRLEEHRYLLPGLVVQTEPRRIYRSRTAVAHLVGYVSEISDQDLASGRFPGSRMGSMVGVDGLEAQYDSLLRGVDGVRYTEVDARGRMVREEVSSPSLSPIGGGPIKTTIDLPLQEYIDSIWRADLSGRRGALIAMRPDGEILALYSAPSYDPNEFIGGIAPALWTKLNTAEDKPLLNRAIRGIYPPASPFKLAIAAMALKRGVVDFHSHMAEPCRGGMQYGNRYIRCWKKEGHGSLDLTGAIAASCDVYFYQLGLKLGLPNLLADGTALGFGERSGIDMGSEQRPIFPKNTQYFTDRYGSRGWTNAVTLNLAIGQGENSQTLINMMRFYSAIAGNGSIGAPYLVRPREVAVRSLGLSPEQLAGLKRALSLVVQGGTASRSGGRDINVAGKTGTSQNPHGKDHGWFIGYAPADHPTVIVGSIMEFAEHGTFVAPYVVRVIRRYLTSRDSTLLKARVVAPVTDDSVTGTGVSLPDSIRP